MKKRIVSNAILALTVLFGAATISFAQEKNPPANDPSHGQILDYVTNQPVHVSLHEGRSPSTPISIPNEGKLLYVESQSEHKPMSVAFAANKFATREADRVKFYNSAGFNPMPKGFVSLDIVELIEGTP